MQPTILVVGCVDVVKRVVSDIIAHVADEEESPENCKTDWIADWDQFSHKSSTHEESHDCQSGRIDQSISK